MLARLTAPPFYLVALPISTLLIGLEVVGWIVLHIVAAYLYLQRFGSAYITIFGPVVLFFEIISFVLLEVLTFCAAMFVSGYLLLRTVRACGERLGYSAKASQYLQGLILLLAFVPAFALMRLFVLEIAKRPQKYCLYCL